MIRSIISHIEYSPSKEVTFVRCKPEQVFTFKEWQFMMVSSDFVHEWLGKQLKKPYSIATTNQELQEQGTIWFVVKKSREWFMSEYLTQGIKVGDVLHLQGPFWHLIDTWKHKKYLLISVGSGLSPMIGLYNTITTNTNNKVAMLYGERYMSQVLPSTLELLWQTGENRFHRLCLSREENIISNDNLLFTNWYVQAQLDNALEFLGTKDVSVFICGKPEMVDDVRKILTDKWVDATNIVFEKY